MERINSFSVPADLGSWDRVVTRRAGFLALARAGRVRLSEAAHMLGLRNGYAYVEDNKDLLVRDGGEVSLSGLGERLAEITASLDEPALGSKELALMKAVDRQGITQENLVLRRTNMQTVSVESRWLLAPHGILARCGKKGVEYHFASEKSPNRSREHALNALLVTYLNKSLSRISIRSIQVNPSPGDIEEKFDVTVYPYCGVPQPQLGTCNKAKVIPVSSSREVIELVNRRTSPDMIMIAPESRALGYLSPTDNRYRLLLEIEIPNLYLYLEKMTAARNRRKEKPIYTTPAPKESWLSGSSSLGRLRERRVVRTPRQQLEAYLLDEKVAILGKNLPVILAAVSSPEHGVLCAVRSNNSPHLLEIWVRDTLSITTLSHIAWTLCRQIELLQRNGIYKEYFDALMSSSQVREWLQLARGACATDLATANLWGKPEICPVCNSNKLQFDHEWVCINCGSVIDDKWGRNGRGSICASRDTPVPRRIAMDQTARHILHQDRKLQRVLGKSDAAAEKLREIERHSRLHVKDLKSALNTIRIYARSTRASGQSDREHLVRIRDWPARLLALAAWGKQFSLENGIPVDSALDQLRDLPWFRNAFSQADLERAASLSMDLEVPADYVETLRAVVNKKPPSVPHAVAEYLLRTWLPSANRTWTLSRAAGFRKKSRNRKRGCLGMVAAEYNRYRRAYTNKRKESNKNVARQFGVSTATLFNYERVIFHTPRPLGPVELGRERSSLKGGLP